MNYIRTIVKVYDINKLTADELEWLRKGEHKEGGDLEELCDLTIIVKRDGTQKPRVQATCCGTYFVDKTENDVFLGIWTNKGLSFVAQQKPSGDWELL